MKFIATIGGVSTLPCPPKEIRDAVWYAVKNGALPPALDDIEVGVAMKRIADGKIPLYQRDGLTIEGVSHGQSHGRAG